MVYVRFMAKGGLMNFFLSIQDVKEGDADGVLDAISAGNVKCLGIDCAQGFSLSVFRMLDCADQLQH